MISLMLHKCVGEGLNSTLVKPLRMPRYHVESLVERNLVRADGKTANGVYEIVS